MSYMRIAGWGLLGKWPLEIEDPRGEMLALKFIFLELKSSRRLR
jgi:hypothetical protein